MKWYRLNGFSIHQAATDGDRPTRTDKDLHTVPTEREKLKQEGGNRNSNLGSLPSPNTIMLGPLIQASASLLQVLQSTGGPIYPFRESEDCACLEHGLLYWL